MMPASTVAVQVRAMPKRMNPAAFIGLPCLPALAAGAEIHWSIDGSPFTFAATVMIPKGTLLRVDPGVTARFAPGARLEVEGQVSAIGTPESPITFERSGSSGSWSGIRGGVTDCEDALDTDDDGTLAITDSIRLLDHLFRGGAALPAPYPGEGVDPTEDSLGCERS